MRLRGHRARRPAAARRDRGRAGRPRAALSGEPVPPGMEELETLVNDMRAERAAPDDEFGAALDHWAAAGFPRGRQPRLSEKATRSDAGGRARMLLASLTPRKLAYAGGAAATLVVLVVAVSQIDFESGGDLDDRAAPPSARKGLDSGGGDLAVPEQVPAVDESRAGQPSRTPPRSRPRRSAGSTEPPAGSPAASRSARRARRAVTLAAPVDEVQDVTNEAISVVESNGGIIESSQTSGTDEQARAILQLGDPDPGARHDARSALRPRRRQVAERGHA